MHRDHPYFVFNAAIRLPSRIFRHRKMILSAITSSFQANELVGIWEWLCPATEIMKNAPPITSVHALFKEIKRISPGAQPWAKDRAFFGSIGQKFLLFSTSAFGKL